LGRNRGYGGVGPYGVIKTIGGGSGSTATETRARNLAGIPIIKYS